MILDLAVIVFYALCMLALGVIAMRKVKTRDDYLVAGRNLGPAFYVGTMSATMLGGASTIGSIKLGYIYGISGFWLCASLGFGIIGISLLLSKQLLKLNIYTVTQVLELNYNKNARYASAVIMMMYALMVAATSTIAMGTIMQSLFGISFFWAVLLGGGLVVLYSTLGGMWSLTLTDIVQFSIMTVGLLFILLPKSLYDAGGLNHLMQTLEPSAFSFTSIGIDTIITYFLIYFLGVFIGQDIWQRVFTARSSRVAQFAGVGAGIYCLFYGLAMALIGVAASVLIPNIENPNNTFAEIIALILPDGIRGLVIAATLAALMSTASATLLAASTSVSQDLYPLIHSKIINPDKDFRKELDFSKIRINRIFTFLLGLVVLVIAQTISDVVGALTIAYNLLVGGMLIPLVGAIYWKKATTKGAISSMILGSICVIAFIIKDGIFANTPIYYSLGVGLLSFVIISLFTTKAN